MEEILVKLHTGHLDITKWRNNLYGGQELEQEVQKCLVCSQFCQQNVCRTITSDLITLGKRLKPICSLEGTNYLILVDCYPHYTEMSKLSSTTFSAVIQFWCMEYQKPLFLTMAPNFHQWPLPSLLWTWLSPPD